MAGKPQKGLRYAGWGTNIFDGDTKIDKLLDAQGWTGFGIYFYLCQMAYKFDEYFYRWSYDDSATTARRMGGGVRSETVRQTVGLCLQIGLFDKRLFDRDGILTSRGIQRRFCAAIQERRRKVVIADYWLLDDEESKGLEKCAANRDLPPADGHLPLADGHLPPADDPERKEKERKEKERKEDRTAPGHDPAVAALFSAYLEKIGGRMTDRIRDELLSFARTMSPECCIRAMDEAVEANVAKWNYVRGILRKKREQGVRCINDWNRIEEERDGTRNRRGASAAGGKAAKDWDIDTGKL